MTNMESSTTELIMQTLPENLKEEGSKLLEISRTLEEERLRDRSYKFRRNIKDDTNKSGQKVETQAFTMERLRKAEEAALPIAIAKLVMELWSVRMRQYAEKLILQKAVQEHYLKENQLKWIHVLGKPEDGESSDDGWLIDDQDNVIIELIWIRFNIKEHFHQVSSHRLWIQRSYDRLKDFFPTLSPEIIERHDLSKFPFNQAIGYTLKWVHNTYHNIWKTACDLHLHNEPHHPQTWSKLYTPREKQKKLEKWMKDVCDFHSGCPYGLDIAKLDLNSEDMAEPFLHESYIDMVAVEWERRKGEHLDITTRELAYIDEKFLKRYTKKQCKIIKNLIEQIIFSDDGWQSTVLTEREKILMPTVPKQKQALFACQVEMQKKTEESRLIKFASRKEKKKGITDEDKEKFAQKEKRGIADEDDEKFAQKEKKGIADEDDEMTKMVRKAHDNAFYIMITKVVTQHWESNFRKYAEKLILKKAIEEKYITDSHLKWVLNFDDQDEDKETDDTHTSSAITFNDKALIELLWVDFKLQAHFSQVQSHRHWVKQSYLRLARFMPELSEELIERHDLSKLSLLQGVGYTLKWVHGINFSTWQKSCDLHLNYEPHHPQMWSKKHTPQFKQSCLESWLCVKADDSKYGVKISSLDLTSEDMAKVFLLESLVDMVAVEWERNKGQRPDLTYTELIYMEDRFLSRYSVKDKEFVLNLMDVIKEADHE